MTPLPCPFCGSSRIVKGARFYAMCVDCGATGPERNADATEKKFMGDWNTRAQQPFDYAPFKPPFTWRLTERSRGVESSVIVDSNGTEINMAPMTLMIAKHIAELMNKDSTK